MRAVMAAAAVARPDPKWDETPGATVTPEDLIAHCKAQLAGFKAPKSAVFGKRRRLPPARSRSSN